MSLRLRLCLIVAIVGALSYAGCHHLLDDALIYFRYMRNVVEGFGLVYNPGEYVNGLTSPLYTYSLLLCSEVLGGHVILAAALLFAACMMGACALAERLTPYAGILLSTMVFFYTVIGMETALLLLLLMLSLTLLLADRTNWLPILLVALMLTRFEAGALIPVAAVYLYRRHKLPSAVAYLPAVALLCAYLLVNHHFYGHYLPNSSTAKLGQARSGYWGRWPRAFLNFHVLRNSFRGAPYSLLFLALAGGWGIYKMKGSAWNALVLPFVVILLCFYVGLNIPPYHWYYAPFVFLLTIYAVMAVGNLRYGVPALVGLAVLQAVTAANVLRKPEPRFVNYARVADWLHANERQTASVEACETGELGWESHLKVIDVLGLTEPKNADHIAHHDASSWLKEDRPDFVVMHQPAWVWETVAEHSPNYTRIPVSSGDVYLLERKDLVAAH